MRFSAIATLCAAPLALAGMLEAQLVSRGGLAKRGSHHVVQEPGHPVQVVKEIKATATTIVIIWINQGAGAPTETIHPTEIAPQATHTVSWNPISSIYNRDANK